MQELGYVRYVDSVLHRMTFPELWKFKHARKRSGEESEKRHIMRSESDPKYVYELSNLAKKHGDDPTTRNSFEVLSRVFEGDSIMKIEDIDPSKRIYCKDRNRYHTLLCWCLLDRDPLDAILSDPRVDVNLVCDDVTPFERILTRFRYYYKYAETWLPILVRRGIIFAIREDFKLLVDNEICRRICALCVLRE